MTKMSCPVKKDSAPGKTDMACNERDSEVDDHLVNAVLQRKDGKCNSPTSSKESHSDRDSDLEDSNSEFQGRLSLSDVILICDDCFVFWSGRVKTIYFYLRN